MSFYPHLTGKDRQTAFEMQGELMRAMQLAEHPKLKSSLAQWAMMLRETLKSQK